MEASNHSGIDLKKLLLSGVDAKVKEALRTLHQELYWRSLVKNSLACPSKYFEVHYENLLRSLKVSLRKPQNVAVLQKKTLPFVLKKIWKEYVVTHIKDEDLLIMFRTKGSMAELALEVCYKRFEQDILNTLQSDSVDRETAKDLLQEGFANVYRNWRNRAEIQEVNLMAYFMQSCKNARSKYWKKQNKMPKADIAILQKQAIQPAVEAQMKATAKEQLKQQILAHLGQTCKKILALAFLGYTNPVIAQRLSYTENYVKRKKSECLDNARGIVKDSKLNW